MANIELFLGDSTEVLKDLPDNCVDAVVTDPPYGLSFMGKKWDYEVPSVELWKEVLRVLKPGGHLLSFGGTRTYHRLAVNIEDAGFEIRDQIQWLYGSGFPKSTDVSKRIDIEAGNSRPIIGKNPAFRAKQLEHNTDWETAMRPEYKTGPASEDAIKWSGYGTALKPANEPIVLARKPLEKGLTVAQNVLKWGVGALNVDASRIASGERPKMIRTQTIVSANAMSGQSTGATNSGELTSLGRWPANVILDEEAAKALDEQSGLEVTKFFYCAKASKRERGEGNVHPTVKPIKLMEYLIRMVTPAGGIVLDPFLGSGTTGVAAKGLGYSFFGIEMSQDYLSIAESRINKDTKVSAETA